MMSILLSQLSSISKMLLKISILLYTRAEMFTILMHMVRDAGLMKKQRGGWMRWKGMSTQASYVKVASYMTCTYIVILYPDACLWGKHLIKIGHVLQSACSRKWPVYASHLTILLWLSKPWLITIIVCVLTKDTSFAINHILTLNMSHFWDIMMSLKWFVPVSLPKSEKIWVQD